MQPDGGALRRPRDPAPPGADRSRREVPPEKRVPGPRCPACHHSNPAGRVRCEVCGEELWHTAATRPASPLAPPPADPEPSSPGRPVAVLVFVPVAVAVMVFLVVVLLG